LRTLDIQEIATELNRSSRHPALNAVIAREKHSDLLFPKRKILILDHRPLSPN
jgi:hypothetical protein